MPIARRVGTRNNNCIRGLCREGKFLPWFFFLTRIQYHHRKQAAIELYNGKYAEKEKKSMFPLKNFCENNNHLSYEKDEFIR